MKATVVGADLAARNVEAVEIPCLMPLGTAPGRFLTIDPERPARVYDAGHMALPRPNPEKGIAPFDGLYRATCRICGKWPKGVPRLDRKAVREVGRLANREMALTQRARMLGAARAIFRFCHVAHPPFALAAQVAAFVHVGVVAAMDATWFR